MRVDGVRQRLERAGVVARERRDERRRRRVDLRDGRGVAARIHALALLDA
jgi:hypothetical protein